MRRRLAQACARGWRQESLVNELLVSQVRIRRNHFGVEVGDSAVGWQSFANLRDRLIRAGFVFRIERNRICMTFPELQD